MKHTKIKILQSVLLVISALAGISLHADPITVIDSGMGAHDTVTVDSSTLGNLNVYAGIVNLTLTQGAQTANAVALCIDPWHLSVSGPQSYAAEALASAPKGPGPMTAAAAVQIGQLWAQYMNSNYALSADASTSAAWSTALQLEVWQTVASSIVTPGVSYALAGVADGFAGEAAAVASAQAAMTTYLAANPSAAAANLEALTSADSQDFVVAGVPDAGATAWLVLLGLAGLAAAAKRASALVPS